MIRIVILSILFLHFFSSKVWAQDAELSVQTPKKAMVGESFSLRYVATSNFEIDELHYSSLFDKFEIVYGPAVIKEQKRIIKGGISSIIYTYTAQFTLKPLLEGVFEIPQAYINIGDNVFKTKSFKLKVVSD